MVIPVRLETSEVDKACSRKPEAMKYQYLLLRSVVKILTVVFTLILLAPWISVCAAMSDSDAFDWVSLEDAQQAAAADGKMIMVFVEADWCGICRRMEREVFPDSEVQRIIERSYQPVTIDVDSRNIVIYNGNEMSERDFARLAGVSATPTFLFIDRHGEILANQVGYVPLERFAALLEYIVSDVFGEISFDEFRK